MRLAIVSILHVGDVQKNPIIYSTTLYCIFFNSLKSEIEEHF